MTSERACRYCGAILVAPHAEPLEAELVVPRTPSMLVPIAGVCLLFGAIGVVVAMRGARTAASVASTAPSVTESSSPASPTAQIPAIPPTPKTAVLVQHFGGKGDGPGKFKQAGILAVDGDANVFVTDADPSRVEQFDATGKFVRQYALSKDYDCCIHGMAVDHAGHLYVSFHDDILRFKTADGSALPPIVPPPPHGLNGQGFEAVAVDAFDMAYALSVGGDGDVGTIVKFDKTGKVVDHFTKKADSHIGTLRGDKMAFDGGGTVFFSQRHGFIEVLDKKWMLQNRIGQEGGGPGELPHFGADAIAPDGHGHLLALGNERIGVFDTGGRYRMDILDSSKGERRLRYFQIGTDGRLYATTDGEEVAVYTLDLGLEDR